MDVDHSPGRQGQDIAPENVPVGDHHSQLGLPMPEGGQEDVAPRAIRLEQRDPVLLGDLLDRGGDQGGARPAVRLVGLGDDSHEVRPLRDQRFQARHRKGRGAEKHDAHQRRRTGSGCSVRMRPESLCSRFQRETRSCRFKVLRWSTKRMPSRWSISCWMARASSPAASRR